MGRIGDNDEEGDMDRVHMDGDGGGGCECGWGFGIVFEMSAGRGGGVCRFKVEGRWVGLEMRGTMLFTMSYYSNLTQTKRGFEFAPTRIECI